MTSKVLDDRLNLRLSSNERDQLLAVAQREERTLSQQVRLVVRSFLAAQQATMKNTSVEVEK